MKDYFYCIDVGGTFIKSGIVSAAGDVLFKTKIKTCPQSETNDLSNNIMLLIEELEKKSNLPFSNALGLGIGIAGLVNSKTGVILKSGNLNLYNYPLLEKLKTKISIPIKIANDADVATLAELVYGSGKGNLNLVMLTLGTGIGSGIVINGKLLQSQNGLSSELGHSKISNQKIKCGCGEYGCFEALASTKALAIMTAHAMKKNKESAMWQTYNLENVCGKTVFEYLDTDDTAKQVFDKYIENLGSGVVNVINTLSPDTIIIGGAVSNQKDRLITPLTDYVKKHSFAKEHMDTKIMIAKFTGDAGIIGARCLFL